MYKPIQLSFVLRASDKRKDGTAPIYMRIRVNGKVTEMSASRKIDPERWDPKARRVKGHSPDARSINAYLDTLKAEANDAHHQLMQGGEDVTAHNVKARMQGKEVHMKPLLELFTEHNNKMEQLIGKDYSENTYKKYKTSYGHLERFMDDPELPVTKVDLDFLEDFEYYLKTKKNPCSHNTTMKYMSHLKKIINLALRKDFIKKDPFLNYDISYKKKTPVYLSQDELGRIENKQIDIDRLSKVRDVFVFSCYTGLSFTDAEQLKQTDVRWNKQGEAFLEMNRTRNNELSEILLLPKAVEIIKRYQSVPETQDGSLLPMISNQKTNAYLKELAALCGINKTLTHYVARSTFAITVLLNNGVPVETVQMIMGHSRLSRTMHYARIAQEIKMTNETNLYEVVTMKSDSLVRLEYPTT
ncbi:site-specific integrase [Fodinibius sediminis]|uniref:Site-specific recombinase XerD n=1 Tax=Fodinibius sediminis TaxID=1214077 RepID=A0A521D792_9BACT|nr:site-specific integrase [Fodinibius sediminis]SMO66951.1 Site-specific recombinase XerD [Fodinibius sediminis]